ncbi:MAG: tetratricopeptide repeat protein [Candidatus Peribacteraceae bacterium]|nr:tetratricopeptide repeat protein [Candidatus Peribacteraceae bacterium]
MKAVGREHVLNLAAIAAVITFVFWICAFKIFDADFFWHVTAGKLMRASGGLITVDPFAYTREGLPYLANHEWLAQIILSVIFDTFGSTGVILLRSALVAASATLILLIGRKNMWIYAPLVMLATLTIRGGAMDRPHLWTWVMVAAFLFLSSRILERGRMRWKDVLIFIGLEVLWVNLHGGAALLGVVISGALVLQLLFERRKIDGPAALPLFLIAALMISPLGWDNIAYLRTLFTDDTTRFIAEWQPRAWAQYVHDLWIFWACALGTLALTRKHLVFSFLILAVAGFLSRTAYRHEMLFVLAATAVTIMQLEDDAVRDAARRHRKWILLSAATATIAVMLYANSLNLAFANRYHAHGYGMNDRTADVVEFIHAHALSGKIFNTYNLGSELLYHLHPSQKVFVDGRNVDYGEEFLSQLFAAATNADVWYALVQKYNFSMVLVDTADLKGDAPGAYIRHLGQDARWSLVYLDDEIAMYLANISLHHDITPYHLLAPENLRPGSDLPTVIDAAALQTELRQSISQAPHSLNARLLLARLLIAQGNIAEAQAPLAEALQLAPDDYRPYEVTGLLLARAGDLDGAEFAFDEALARLGRSEAIPIREYVARIFEQLGEAQRAKKYH